MRRYHSAPAGSAASERIFSSGRNVLGLRRLRLKSQNMELLLFLKYNFRAFCHGDLKSPPKDFKPPNQSSLPNSLVISTMTVKNLILLFLQTKRNVLRVAGDDSTNLLIIYISYFTIFLFHYHMPGSKKRKL